MLQELRRDAVEHSYRNRVIEADSRHVPTLTDTKRSHISSRGADDQSANRPSGRQPRGDRFLPVFVVVFAVLNAADLISTFVGLHHGMREGNPLMSMLLATYGFAALVFYKVIVVAAVAFGVRLLREFRVSVAKVTIVVCNLLVLFVVIANVAQYFLRT